MEKYAKDELYSDKYKPADFLWGQSLGEGKYSSSKAMELSIFETNTDLFI